MARRSAVLAVNGRKLRCSDRFLTGLSDVDSVTFVSHVNPDPDALASMMGLAYLVETRLGKPTRLTRDGLISRAENAAMVELLQIPLVPIEEVELTEGEALVMVDSQPNTGRHSLERGTPSGGSGDRRVEGGSSFRIRRSGSAVPLYAVIDHHDTPGEVEDVPFVDIRHGLGATSSLVVSYLMEQNVLLPRRLATALLYGIETEVHGYPREASPLDDSALVHLYPLADKDLIARIRNARLPQGYFGCFLQALQSSFIYDKLIISWVTDLPNPELAAEVVDFMIRFEEVDYALCGGVCGDRLVLSLRAAVKEARAGLMLKRVVNGLGRAGGHDRRAGGFIPLASTAPSAVEQVQSELRRRLLKVLDIDECRGQRLVPRREMLQNIQA